jgi:hypothetical protein
MITAVKGSEALKARRAVKSRGTGEAHWRTDFIGRHGDGQFKEEPQAFLIDMSANETIMPHFHEVDQFQVFVAGAGSLGREAAAPLVVHYVDHHTGYGPINAGPQGYSYFTLRAATDPGAHYLHRPGYREALKPSRKRHATADGIALSTEPVLTARSEVAVEPLLKELDCSDGLGAWLVRLGPGAITPAPAADKSAGQHLLVVNGSLECCGASYPAWSVVFVGRGEPSPELKAGERGLEVLVLHYPGKPALP